MDLLQVATIASSPLSLAPDENSTTPFLAPPQRPVLMKGDRAIRSVDQVG